jgi:cation diffusion facilitator CzcD-associated flavoprotein CzcO
MDDDYDVLIVGAGVSGIGMACQLATKCPDKRMAILERRTSMGGTWDLFRYPGVRSDSDMLTYGFRFRPWMGASVFADGPSIKRYLTETAREYRVDEKIQFSLRILRSEWLSAEKHWVVTAAEEDTGNERHFTCSFLVVATGYYNFDRGYLPTFPGKERFKGLFIHPQHWPERVDYRGKRVVVIGSGATAVTIVPSLAREAAHVIMLQRSPSYVFPFPGKDPLGVVLRRVLSTRWAYALLRRRNVLIQRSMYRFSRRFPRLARSLLLASARRRLGPGFDMSHFSPSYMPWDERLCVAPDGDLYEALRENRASVITDRIETFTERGIALKSGRELEADIVVAATGLDLQVLGGMELRVDGEVKKAGDRMTYKGVLVQDIPNFAILLGYTNAAWTLRVDVAADYVCRLLKEMDRRRVRVVTPRAPSGELQNEGILDALKAGYVRRGGALMPRQGRDVPWRVLHHYEKDRVMFRRSVDDPALEWGAAAPRPVLQA